MVKKNEKISRIPIWLLMMTFAAMGVLQGVVGLPSKFIADKLSSIELVDVGKSKGVAAYIIISAMTAVFLVFGGLLIKTPLSYPPPNGAPIPGAKVALLYIATILYILFMVLNITPNGVVFNTDRMSEKNFEQFSLTICFFFSAGWIALFINNYQDGVER